MTAAELRAEKAKNWEDATYEITIGTWREMTAELLGLVLRDAGSVRKAAPILDVPRSTLAARWARWTS